MAHGVPSIVNDRVTSGSMLHVILATLAEHGGLTTQEISDVSGCKRARVIELMRPLVKSGLITRRPTRNAVHYNLEYRCSITPAGLIALAHPMTEEEALRTAYAHQEERYTPEYERECEQRKQRIDAAARFALVERLNAKAMRPTKDMSLRSVIRRYFRAWRKRVGTWQVRSEAYYVSVHDPRKWDSAGNWMGGTA